MEYYVTELFGSGIIAVYKKPVSTSSFSLDYLSAKFGLKLLPTISCDGVNLLVPGQPGHSWLPDS